MFKRLLTALGIGGDSTNRAASKSMDVPYRDESTILIYHLLFCDRLDLFEENYQGTAIEPWRTLFDANPDLGAVARLAEDSQQESRVRVLAYNMLRANTQPVPEKDLFATIIEMHMDQGLDTLAVFADGGVRYLNHTGKIAVVDGMPNPFRPEIDKLFEASQPIVGAIGPWNKERLPPPNKGLVRMTFLVSDGLYFGQGPIEIMAADPMSAPLIEAATALLVKLVDKTTNS